MIKNKKKWKRITLRVTPEFHKRLFRKIAEKSKNDNVTKTAHDYFIPLLERFLEE